MLKFFRRYSRKRFAQKIQRAIAAAGRPTDFEYDPEAFLLRRPNTVANLTPTYHAYRQATGDQRKRIFDNFITAFTQQGKTDLESFSDVESKLVAVVRERAFLATMEGPGWGLDQAPDPTAWPAHEPISKWFSKAIVVDFPTHVAAVNRNHLKQWGLTFDEAFAIGLAKLRDCTLPKFRSADGYFVGTWGDDYDSSRILLPSLFEDIPLNGDPVIALPNRLTLMVAGSEDHAAIQAMLAKAEAVLRDSPKPQNHSPLILRQGAISDFEVESTSPLFNSVQRARKIAAMAVYEDQKANLTRHYQQSGKNLFVAQFIPGETAGHYESYSVWSKGVPSLLPETDSVMFFDESQPEPHRMLGRAPWKAVQALAGDLMLDTQMFPPRHYVSSFPSPAQLQAFFSSR